MDDPRRRPSRTHGRRPTPPAPDRAEPFETMSGVPVDAVYGDGAVARASIPYTRGIHASMYRSQLWTMRMFAGFGTAEDTNARFNELLRAGGTGLSTAFDMPTLMGRDSDHPWAVGEVGRAGVAIDTLADMDDLFARHRPVGSVTTSMTINGPAVDRDGDVHRHGREPRHRARPARRHDPERHLQGVPGAEGVHLPAAAVGAPGDRLDALHHRRDAEVEPASRSAATTSARRARPPRKSWRSRSPTGSRTSKPRARPGLDVDEFAPRLVVLLQQPPRLLRGDRQVPRRAPHLGAVDDASATARSDERSLKLRFHTQTAGVSLTAQQPEINIARVALQALAAVLGGTQSLHTDASTRRWRCRPRRRRGSRCARSRSSPTRPASPNVADPLGGAPYVEWMTDEMERQAEEVFAHLARARRRLDARRRLRRHRQRLLRRARSPTRPTASNARSTPGGASSSASTPSPTATTAVGATLYIDRRHRRAAAASDSRRSSTAATATPCTTRSRTSRPIAADPTANLMPALIDAVQAHCHRRRDRRRARRRLRLLHREGDRVMRSRRRRSSHPRQARPRRPRPRAQGRRAHAARRRLRGRSTSGCARPPSRSSPRPSKKTPTPSACRCTTVGISRSRRTHGRRRERRRSRHPGDRRRHRPRGRRAQDARRSASPRSSGPARRPTSSSPPCAARSTPRDGRDRAAGGVARAGPRRRSARARPLAVDRRSAAEPTPRKSRRSRIRSPGSAFVVGHDRRARRGQVDA